MLGSFPFSAETAEEVGTYCASKNPGLSWRPRWTTFPRFMTYGEKTRDGAMIRTGWTLMPLVSCVAQSFKGSVWQSRLSEEETVRKVDTEFTEAKRKRTLKNAMLTWICSNSISAETVSCVPCWSLKVAIVLITDRTLGAWNTESHLAQS